MFPKKNNNISKFYCQAFFFFLRVGKKGTVEKNCGFCARCAGLVEAPSAQESLTEHAEGTEEKKRKLGG